MGGGWRQCSRGGAAKQGHGVPGLPQDAAALPQVQGPVRYVVVRVLVCFMFQFCCTVSVASTHLFVVASFVLWIYYDYYSFRNILACIHRC